MSFGTWECYEWEAEVMNLRREGATGKDAHGRGKRTQHETKTARKRPESFAIISLDTSHGQRCIKCCENNGSWSWLRPEWTRSSAGSTRDKLSNIEAGVYRSRGMNQHLSDSWCTKVLPKNTTRRSWDEMRMIGGIWRTRSWVRSLASVNSTSTETQVLVVRE
jgi:hypothetical protein